MGKKLNGMQDNTKTTIAQETIKAGFPMDTGLQTLRVGCKKDIIC
jgi:hypothetical protein